MNDAVLVVPACAPPPAANLERSYSFTRNKVTAQRLAPVNYTLLCPIPASRMSQKTEIHEPTSLLLSSLVRLTKSVIPNRPLDPLSFSSQQCASWRAMEMKRTNPLVTDPYAEALAGPVAMSRAEKMGQPRYPRFSVRTRFFDDFATHALADCTQVVLLGAGMDMRAYRLTAVTSNIKVFEIDVDSVLNLKEKLLSNITPPPQPRGQLTRVRADATSDWATKLLNTTFDSCERTVWLVEGLVYYLDQSQVDALFRQIFELSASGSAVCFSAVSKLSEGRKGLASMFKSAMSDPEAYLDKFGLVTTRIVELGGPEANYGRWPPRTDGPRRESTIYVTACKP